MLLRNGAYLVEAGPDHNLMFSVHMWWTDDNPQRVTDAIHAAVEADLPLMVGVFAHKGVGRSRSRSPIPTASRTPRFAHTPSPLEAAPPNERRPLRAMLVALTLAALTLVGIIHSPVVGFAPSDVFWGYLTVAVICGLLHAAAPSLSPRGETP